MCHCADAVPQEKLRHQTARVMEELGQLGSFVRLADYCLWRVLCVCGRGGRAAGAADGEQTAGKVVWGGGQLTGKA